MARPLRVEFEGGFYHVTARGNERQPIYRDDADRPIFVGLLAKVVEQFELRLHAYVLMREIGGCFGYAVSRAIELVTREAQVEPRSARIVNSLITILKT